MGYDDNTPLSGVTGGGLPAEIWRETMLRVHEGLTPKPLPMRIPAQPANPGKPKKTGPRKNVGEVIDGVLRDIFGGKRP
jgi:membrane peptidoglycan carboxypeptidase